jgi:Ethanolamine utilization protein EutJ (predicted chaperonin)
MQRLDSRVKTQPAASASIWRRDPALRWGEMTFDCRRRGIVVAARCRGNALCNLSCEQFSPRNAIPPVTVGVPHQLSIRPLEIADVAVATIVDEPVQTAEGGA